jgi:putative N-acetylmannosamine-6-phosphate epimerase
MLNDFLAVLGGAKGIRTNSVEDIKEIKEIKRYKIRSEYLWARHY